MPGGVLGHHLRTLLGVEEVGGHVVAVSAYLHRAAGRMAQIAVPLRLLAIARGDGPGVARRVTQTGALHISTAVPPEADQPFFHGLLRCFIVQIVLVGHGVPRPPEYAAAVVSGGQEERLAHFGAVGMLDPQAAHRHADVEPTEVLPCLVGRRLRYWLRPRLQGHARVEIVARGDQYKAMSGLPDRPAEVERHPCHFLDRMRSGIVCHHERPADNDRATLTQPTEDSGRPPPGRGPGSR
ncbi:hypothetical protein SCOCK_630032 [Actinacidiphila cocklensis]|uniref:Uncharacterized protein n=1 Tax=Actinacidiphila cocklensis TaxID=887465 RepID=A0A9W4DZ84_9ACTN|nr:hypothetical protein SCOCK_630032 [Actinacidiphila cocklensis]